MMKHMLLFIICVGLLVLPGLAEQDTDKSASEYRYDDFKVIAQRNMFSRNRRSLRPEPKTEIRTVKKSVVLSLYVLKGVAINDGQKVAFIEEEVSGETIRAIAGDELMNGHIAEVQFTHVLFEEDGQTKTIRLGEMFAKKETVSEARAEAEEDASLIETTESDTNSDTDSGETSSENDLLKKLMQRRKSELGN